MAFQAEACITIRCDLCAYVLDEEGDGAQHYRTEADALKYALAQGWHRLKDGRIVCNDTLSEEHMALVSADAFAGLATAEPEISGQLAIEVTE